MNVWLDDERPMPVGYDVHIRTAADAIALIAGGGVLRISLDHDLGAESAGTGYDVAKAIEAMAFHGTIARLEVLVHTANPVGRANMVSSLLNADRFWSARETPSE